MKKLLLVRRVIVLSLVSCSTFLYGAEKTTVQNSTNPDIQSIVLEKDNLIIKSKGKIYTFKLSELLKEKTTKLEASKIKKPAPKNLKEAFKYNGEWCFFNAPKSKLNRLNYIKKRGYKVFKEGNLLEKILYKNKYYARDLSKNIYQPIWGMKKDFSPHLIPAKQYIESLDNKIKLLEIDIPKLKQKLSQSQNSVKYELRRYLAFAERHNIKTTITTKNGTTITRESSGKFSSKIKSQLRDYKKSIKKQESNIKNMTRKVKRFEYKLRDLLKFKFKIEALYKQHAINQK